MSRRPTRLNGPWVFLGPSLARSEAERLCPPATFAPPAAQGDVWRAIAERPQAIVLIDGVFEASPSVWHQELLAALRAGIPVFGGGSMGALRAAELSVYGMVGVGRIFEAFRDGTLVDDSEVAMLHATSEVHHRALTVPLVNVRFTASEALTEKILSASEARLLVEQAAAVFYQDRYWPTLLSRMRSVWPTSSWERFRAWVGKGPRDLKALDAAQTLRQVMQHLKALKAGSVPVSAARGSSLVRRRRLSINPPTPVPSALDAKEGVRRLLLAMWARSVGTTPPRGAVQAWRERFARAARAQGLDTSELAIQLGLGADSLERSFEDLALEAWVSEHATRWFQDGPSDEEGLALERLRAVIDVVR